MRKKILLGTLCCSLLVQMQIYSKAQSISLSEITALPSLDSIGQKKVESSLLNNLQKTGVKLYPLETLHGLQSWVFQKNSTFFSFFLTPDGKAMVPGVFMNMSPEMMLKLDGKNIDHIPASHGLEGLFVRTEKHFQVFYITPDRQKVIPGMMWDEEGRNITQTQIANLIKIKTPDAISTHASPNQKESVETEKQTQFFKNDSLPTGPSMNIFTNPRDEASKAIFALLNQSYGGIYGKADTPALLVFIDPLCHYSKQAIALLDPYVKAGKLHLVIIPIAVLDSVDGNQSSKQARMLLSAPANQMVETWTTGTSIPFSIDSSQKLATNQKLIEGLHLRGTPIFFWQRPDQSIRHFEGLPDSMDSLVKLVENGK